MNNILKIALFLLAISGQAHLKAKPKRKVVIQGKVKNSSNGSGQAGVHVTFVGSDNMTMTEPDGSFKLETFSPSGMIQVVAPGFDVQIIPVREQQEVCVWLIPESQEESFYNNTFLSAYSDSRTTNKSFLKDNADLGEELSVLGNSRIISHSGLDGGGQATFIWGLNSLNMGTQPLFIVDGVEWLSQDNVESLHQGYFSNPLSLLSPDDIESIKVMKNGTAIYGSKAAGGVVIINTKRAHSMATEIMVNVSTGIKLPFKTIPMMNATDYRIYATDVMSGITGEWKDRLDRITFTDDNLGSSTYPSTHNNTDWMDMINKTGFTQNYNIGIRGGDERALCAFSLGYNRNKGNIDQTNMQRLFVRFNSDINLSKKLFAQADIAFSQVTRELFDDGFNAYTSPAYLAYIKSPLYSPYQFDATGKLFDRISDKDELDVGNPLAIIKNAESAVKNYRFTANLAPKFQLNKYLSISAQASFSWDKVKEDAFTPDFGLNEMKFYNEQGDYYGQGNNKVATLMTRHSNLLLGGRADYIPLYGAHYLAYCLGYHYQTDSFIDAYGVGYNTGSDNLKSLSVTSNTLRTNGSNHDNWKETAWYATGDYSYLNRYYISGQVALESDSRFGRQADGALHIGGVSWFLASSITGAWIMTGEGWMNALRFVNYLKLYATYEVTGNNNLPYNATRTYFTSIPYVGQARGLQLANIGNEGLLWETTRRAYVGLDANLFGNRVALNANVYLGKTSQLLIQKQLPEEFGLGYYYSNDGELKNVGFNINLKCRIIDTRSWKLNLRLSTGHYSNRILYLGDGAFTTDIAGGTVLTTVGQPVGVFYGYKSLGVFTTQAEADAACLAVMRNNGTKFFFAAGDTHYQDINFDGLINIADRQIIGDPNPDLYGHFGFNLQFHGLNLNTVFTYSLGNDAYNALRAQLENGSSLVNQTTNMIRRWTADGQITDVPRATYGDLMGNAAFSNRWIEDASYLKLRQLSLSYDIPVKFKFVQSMQVWLAVDHVFSISKYTGVNPEFAYGNNALYQGIDIGLIPHSRTYKIGFKFGL